MACEVLRDFWGITGEWLKFDGKCAMLSHLPILAEWAQLGVVRSAQPVAVEGFSGARVWRVSGAGGTFALRRWPAPGLPAVRIRELHRCTRFLAEHGIDVVPVPVPSRSGETLVRDEWQLEPWMPGAADFHAAPTTERLRRVMQLLARLHVIAARYECSALGASWFATHAAQASPALRERQALISEWDAPRVLVAHAKVAQIRDDRLRSALAAILAGYVNAAPSVAGRMQALSDVRFALHPCLRDIWHDHVLFTGEEVTGLIDLSATRFENVASDLSRLLGSLVGDDFHRWDVALQEYETLRPLTGHERRLVEVLDQSSVLLSGLTWVDRLTAEEVAPADRERVIDRVGRIGSRLAMLIDRL